MDSDMLTRPVITLEDWNSVPPKVHNLILARLPLNDIFKAPLVCTSFRDATKRATFHQVRASFCPLECRLSNLVLCEEKDVGWYLRGFDLEHQIRTKLPLFKDRIMFDDIHNFVGDIGLLCLTVRQFRHQPKLYVCNPLTGEFMLPALEFSPHPVVVHAHVAFAKRNTDIVASSYWVVAIDYARGPSTPKPRKSTHVYDSVTGKWEVGGDVPESFHPFVTPIDIQAVYCESLK